MAAKYDVVIIGGGPNGLTAGAYLAKAGVKVLVVDKRLELGGALATELVTTVDRRYLHNTHAVYMMMVDYAPAYKSGLRGKLQSKAYLPFFAGSHAFYRWELSLPVQRPG